MTVCDQDYVHYERTGGIARRIVQSLAAWLDERRVAAARRRKDRLNRQAFRALLGKEDWVYRDMGVSKADVEWAANLPPHINAARELDRIRDRARLGR